MLGDSSFVIAFERETLRVIISLRKHGIFFLRLTASGSGFPISGKIGFGSLGKPRNSSSSELETSLGRLLLGRTTRIIVLPWRFFVTLIWFRWAFIVCMILKLCPQATSFRHRSVIDVGFSRFRAYSLGFLAISLSKKYYYCWFPARTPDPYSALERIGNKWRFSVEGKSGPGVSLRRPQRLPRGDWTGLRNVRQIEKAILELDLEDFRFEHCVQFLLDVRSDRRDYAAGWIQDCHAWKGHSWYRHMVLRIHEEVGQQDWLMQMGKNLLQQNQ